MLEDVSILAAGVFTGLCKDGHDSGPFPEGVTHEVGVAGVVVASAKPRVRATRWSERRRGKQSGVVGEAAR
jgi:hypothetical protein